MIKIIFDLLPITLFFSTYMCTNDIYMATQVLVLLCILQLIYIKFFHYKTSKINIISNIVIIILGSTTIFLENDVFIKSKPTIIYWMIGLTILFYKIVLRHDFIRNLLENNIILPDKIWNYINKLWIYFFIVMGYINMFIAFSGFFSEKEWVIFKTIGFPVVFITFVVIQFLYFKKHIHNDNE